MHELIPTAPFEVASDSRTQRWGDFLFLDGQTYKCPELTPDMVGDVVRSINRNLNICENNCTGVKRIWHKVTGNIDCAPK